MIPDRKNRITRVLLLSAGMVILLFTLSNQIFQAKTRAYINESLVLSAGTYATCKLSNALV
jgi:hypothetical protein